jgi:hypothetical protein
MRKISLILAVLLFAAPAWATVTITATCIEPNEVEITYSTDGNLPRAFALGISVTNGTIDKIDGYKTGECNAVSRGYGIFPGTIDINDSGGVEDYGTPVAPATAPDGPGQLPSASIVIEMGSLYDDPNNKPLLIGKLCSVYVSGEGSVCVTLSEEDTYRGGVVMEDPNEDPTVVLDDGCCLEFEPPCYVGQPDYDLWVEVGSPPCWCYPRQCHGDTDNNAEGGSKTGYNYVHFSDLTVMLSAWSILEPNDGNPYPGGPGIDWPDPNICADFAHDQEGGTKTGYNRVHFSDLTILLSSWNILEPNYGNPYPGGPGIPPDCLD